MKDGVSFTIHKQYSNLLNGNHYHHVEAKAFESKGVKERLCLFFIFFSFAARSLSIMISSLKVVNKEMYCTLASFVALGMGEESFSRKTLRHGISK